MKERERDKLLKNCNELIISEFLNISLFSYGEILILFRLEEQTTHVLRANQCQNILVLIPNFDWLHHKGSQFEAKRNQEPDNNRCRFPLLLYRSVVALNGFAWPGSAVQQKT